MQVLFKLMFISGLGYNCTGNVPCNDQSSVCDSTTTQCVCKSTHYDSNGADVGGTCVESL
jgi:hypothetical protein